MSNKFLQKLNFLLPIKSKYFLVWKLDQNPYSKLVIIKGEIEEEIIRQISSTSIDV